MIQCREDGVGVIVPVRAQAGASRSRVVGEHGGALKIAVAQAAEAGKANAAISDLLAEFLGVRRSQVEIASGMTSKSKTFRVTGLSLAEAEAKVNETLDH